MLDEIRLSGHSTTHLSFKISSLLYNGPSLYSVPHNSHLLVRSGFVPIEKHL